MLRRTAYTEAHQHPQILNVRATIAATLIYREYAKQRHAQSRRSESPVNHFVSYEVLLRVTEASPICVF